MNKVVNISFHKFIELNRFHDKLKFCSKLRNLFIVINTFSYLILMQTKDKKACFRYFKIESVQKDFQTQKENRSFVDYAIHS